MSQPHSVALSIITVSYNTLEYTLQTLRSAVAEIERSPLLKKQTEIFVVDNNSQDGSPAACEKYLAAQTCLASYKVFANKDNLGFAKANNQATKVSTGKYVLLLNSDTITQPGSLEQLVKTFEAYPIQEDTAHLMTAEQKIDRLGLLSPTLLNPDNSLQHQGGDLPNLWTVFVQMSFLDDLPIIGRFFHSTQHTGRTGQQRHGSESAKTAQPLQVMGWIGGTAMGIRRELIEEIGMLDGNIFMYGEDIEYCLRAKNHHWDIAIDPQAKITHFGQASSSSKNAILGEMKGYLYIWSKHFPAWQLPILKLILRWGAVARILLYKVRGQARPVEIYTEALSIIR
jgi:GT2 family glycosyltransferase